MLSHIEESYMAKLKQAKRSESSKSEFDTRISFIQNNLIDFNLDALCLSPNVNGRKHRPSEDNLLKADVKELNLCNNLMT